MWLIDAYGAGVLLLLALRILIGERWGVIALANTFLHFILAPCLLLALLRLRWRRRVLAWLNMVPALLLLTYYAPQFLPRPAPPPPNAESLTVLSYNVRSGQGRETLLADIVREANADMVLLQDLHPEAADTLETLFATEYPQRVFRIAERRGWMIMSRRAFAEAPLYRAEDGYLRATVMVAGQRVTVYNVHLYSPSTDSGLDFATRTRQLDALLEDVDAISAHPVIMMGDFNFSEWSEPYARISSIHHDAHRVRGWGLGLTRDIAGDIPIARIDFAFYSAGLQAVDFQTSVTSYGSDHRPIVAVFK